MTPDAAELQRRARQVLPRHLYEYYAGGSGRERTLRASGKAWRQVWFAPRVLRDVTVVDTATRLLGTPVATPLCAAPSGYQGLAHPDGEPAAAAGAARAGALYVLSTRSTRRIEDVAQAVAAHGGTWWFQVYVMRDRSLTEDLVRRAAAAGAKALVLTGDTPAVGRKRRDSDALGADEVFLVNLGPLADLSSAAQAADVTFADISWLGEVSGGLPVVVKGVLRPDDATACQDHGAAGVIVSNHGGRQLDGALPSALALPGVAAALAGQGGPGHGGPGQGGPGHGGSGQGEPGQGEPGQAVPGQGEPGQAVPGQGEPGQAVPGQGETGHGATGGGRPPVEVYADGGIRTGEDALAALALGASAVFLGRPVLWALACGGADGVASLLDGLTDDLRHAMTLAGVTSPASAAGLAQLEPAGWQLR